MRIRSSTILVSVAVSLMGSSSGLNLSRPFIITFSPWELMSPRLVYLLSWDFTLAASSMGLKGFVT